MKNYYLEGIGNISLKKHPKSKRLKIVIQDPNTIRVTLPVYISYESGVTFLKSKEEWIRKTVDKIKANTSGYTLFTPSTQFRTKEHLLKISQTGALNSFKFSLGNGVMNVFVPSNEDIIAASCQNKIRTFIEFTLRREAKKYLPERLRYLAHKYKFNYNRVFIKSMKTRWGSCSSKNNINLNIHLMRLPDELIDYVLIHELNHTIHKNHGRSFWSALNSVIYNASELDKRLRKYRIQYY